MATHQDYLKARDLALKLRERVLRNRRDVEAVNLLDALTETIGAEPNVRNQTVLLALSRQAEELLRRGGSSST